MDFKQQALKKGGDFRLAAVTDKIMKVFNLMNLTKAISVHATVEEAGKAF
jgi:anti-anti-sigma regulatory factor